MILHDASRPPRRRAVRAALLGGGLTLAALAVPAQELDDGLAAPIPFAPDAPPSAEFDAAVYSLLLPAGPVLSRALINSAVNAAIAHPVDPRTRPLVPATAVAAASPARPGPRPLGPVDPSALAASPAMIRLVPGEVVQVHADGLPGPNAPNSDPQVRVLPREVNPGDVKVGARWGSEDRVRAPLLPEVALSAQADLLAGPTPSGGPVRRSLRISAQWDTLSDLSFGVTPGVQRLGGGTLEHYVAGLQASTVDARLQPARWRSFIEVSGEKLSPGNLIENSSAQVHAGATYASSSATQLDVSVTRGTMPQSDLQSSVGLQVRF
jgi:hypothetical protein